MIKDLVKSSRSFRRFFEDEPVSLEILRDLVDVTRFGPSAANRQPLKYYLSCDPEGNAVVFPHLAWAGYLKDWPGPSEGERPAAYIVILGDTAISSSFHCDHGIAAQNILLAAAEKGLGGCIFASIDRKGLHGSLGLPEHCEILLVIALGKPKEKVVIEEMQPGGDHRYWRDENSVHHVPKRSLEEIII